MIDEKDVGAAVQMAIKALEEFASDSVSGIATLAAGILVATAIEEAGIITAIASAPDVPVSDARIAATLDGIDQSEPVREPEEAMSEVVDARFDRTEKE